MFSLEVPENDESHTGKTDWRIVVFFCSCVLEILDFLFKNIYNPTLCVVGYCSATSHVVSLFVFFLFFCSPSLYLLCIRTEPVCLTVCTCVKESSALVFYSEFHQIQSTVLLVRAKCVQATLKVSPRQIEEETTKNTSTFYNKTYTACVCYRKSVLWKPPAL